METNIWENEIVDAVSAANFGIKLKDETKGRKGWINFDKLNSKKTVTEMESLMKELGKGDKIALEVNMETGNFFDFDIIERVPKTAKEDDGFEIKTVAELMQDLQKDYYILGIQPSQHIDETKSTASTECVLRVLNKELFEKSTEILKNHPEYIRDIITVSIAHGNAEQKLLRSNMQAFWKEFSDTRALGRAIRQILGKGVSAEELTNEGGG